MEDHMVSFAPEETKQLYFFNQDIVNCSLLVQDIKFCAWAWLRSLAQGFTTSFAQ